MPRLGPGLLGDAQGLGGVGWEVGREMCVVLFSFEGRVLGAQFVVRAYRERYNPFPLLINTAPPPLL